MASSRRRYLAILNIGDAPDPDLIAQMLPRSCPKHGWRWVRSESGHYWGVRDSTLLQVRDERSEYPARHWVQVDDQWEPSTDWQPVKELL
jgi:hypothetical protein